MDIFTNLRVQMDKAINVVDLRESDMDLVNLHLMVNGQMDDMSFDDTLRVAEYIDSLSASAQSELWGNLSFNEQEYFGLESGVFGAIADGAKAAGRGMMKVIRAIWDAFMKVVRKVGGWFGIKGDQTSKKKDSVEKAEKAIDDFMEELKKEVDAADISDESALKKMVKDSSAFDNLQSFEKAFVKTDVTVDETSSAAAAVVLEVEIKKENAPRGSLVVEETDDTVTVQPKAADVSAAVKEVAAGKLYSVSTVVLNALSKDDLVNSFNGKLGAINKAMVDAAKVQNDYQVKMLTSKPPVTDFEKDLVDILRALAGQQVSVPVSPRNTLANVIDAQKEETYNPKKEVPHATIIVIAEKVDFDALGKLSQELESFNKDTLKSVDDLEKQVAHRADKEPEGKNKEAYLKALSALDGYMMKFQRILATTASRMMMYTVEAVNLCDQAISYELALLEKTTVVVTNVPANKRKTQRGKRGKKK